MAQNDKIAITFDTKSMLADINEYVSKVEKELSSLEKFSSEINIGDSFVVGIKEALSELKLFQKEYATMLKSFASTKVDTKDFVKFQKQINTAIENINGRITIIEKSFKEFQTVANGFNSSGFENRITSMIKEFDSFNNKVNETTKLLKQFFDMTNNSVKNSGNIDTSKYEKLNKILKNLQDNEIGKKSRLNIDYDEAIKQLEKFSQKFYDLQDELDNAKSNKDSKAINKIQNQLAQLNPEISKIINRIIELKKLNTDSLLSGEDSTTKVGKIFLTDLVADVENSTDKVIESIKKAKSKMSEEIKEFDNTTATSFEFKNGGIQIPILLDKSTIGKIKPDIEKVIEALNSYSQKNPVNVTMRLFTLKGSRAEQREINKELTNIQANISKLPEGELKESLNGIYGNLESQFRRALKLEVEVELSDKAKDISKIVNDIKSSVGQEKIPIYPEIVISSDEEEKLRKRLKEIQDGFSFNLTSEITKMADSLKGLISQDGAEKWGKTFLDSLNNIESKLKEVQPLIESLTGTTNNKKKITSNEDINIIEQFSNTIKELNAILVQEKDMSINIDIDAIIEKMSSLQSMIVLVHSGLGNLQAVLSNVNNTGGLQVIITALDRIEKIISELNTKKIDINADIDVDKVIPNIQDEILRSGKKIKLPISVLLSSVDDFINEIQFIIDSKLTNGDIGNESFIPDENEDLGNKQVTSLNKRINNLKDKIDSTWENWHNFATAAQNGSKFATDGIDNIISKLGELDFWINALCNKFNNIDFTNQISELKEIFDIVTHSANEIPISSTTNNIKETSTAIQKEEVVIKNSSEQTELVVKKTSEAIKQEGIAIDDVTNAYNSYIKAHKQFNSVNSAQDAFKQYVQNANIADGWEIKDVKVKVDDKSFNFISGSVTLINQKLQETIQQTYRVNNATGKLEATVDALGKNYQALNKQSEKNAQSVIDYNSNVNKLLNRLLSIDSKRYIQSLSDEINNTVNSIRQLQKQDLDIVTKEDLYDLKNAENLVDNIFSKAKDSDYKLLNEKSLRKALGKINELLSSNTKSDFKKLPLYQNLRSLQNELKSLTTKNTESELDALINKLLKFGAEFKDLNTTVKGKNFLEIFKERLVGVNAQFLTTYFSFQDWIRYGRTALSTIRELDTALVDLRKTTTMSNSELNQFYFDSNDVAKQLGVTTAEVIAQASAWSRLNKIGLLYGNI